MNEDSIFVRYLAKLTFLKAGRDIISVVLCTLILATQSLRDQTYRRRSLELSCSVQGLMVVLPKHRAIGFTSILWRNWKIGIHGCRSTNG